MLLSDAMLTPDVSYNDVSNGQEWYSFNIQAHIPILVLITKQTLSRPGVIVICNSNDYNCSSNSNRWNRMQCNSNRKQSNSN